MAQHKATLLAGVSTLVFLAACGTKANSSFCDESTPCSAPAASFCDISGEFGPVNTCVAPPPDAATGTVILTIELTGQGLGSVSSDDGNLQCVQSPCTFEVAVGTEVTLEATADTNTSFVSWVAPCAGFGACDLVITESTTLAAIFEPQGSVLWSFKPTLSGPINSQESAIFPVALATSSQDETVVVGGHVGKSDFGGGPLDTGNTIGSAEVFVAQYSSSGSHLWSNAYQDQGFGEAIANAVAFTSEDELVVIGRFEESLNFGGPGEALDGSVFERFMARLAPDGSHISSVGFEGSGSEKSLIVLNQDDEVMVSNDRSRYDWFNAADSVDRTLVPSPPGQSRVSFGALDGFGRAIVAGSMSNQIDFTPAVNGGDFGEDGESHGYIVKLNWDGTNHSGTDRARGIKCIASDPNGDGSYYIVGSTSEMMTLGLDVINPIGARDAYLAKLSNTNDALWTVALPSTTESRATACALDARGDLVIGGSFLTDVRLARTGAVHTGSGTFVAKYRGNTGELLWETIGTGEATVQALSTDSVGRTMAAYMLAAEAVTIGGETLPADAAPNMLLVQYAP